MRNILLITLLACLACGVPAPFAAEARDGYRQVVADGIYHLLNGRAVLFGDGSCEEFSLLAGDPNDIGALFDGEVEFYTDSEYADFAFIAVYGEAPALLEYDFYDAYYETYEIFASGPQVLFVDTETGDRYAGVLTEDCTG